jgi:hypothetical protein
MAGRRVAVLQTERLLGRSSPGDDDIKGLIERFTAEQNESILLCGLRGERSGYHFLFENLETGRLTLADFFAQAADHPKANRDLSLRFGTFIYHPRLYEDHAFMLISINQALTIAQLPLQEQPQAWKAWKHNLLTEKANTFVEKRKLLTFLLLPALDRVGMAALQDHARLSCILTALAAERFRLAHKRWPRDLQELVPTYLSEVPIDPFDGKLLKFAQRDDGIVIYSVGQDGKDDGGDIHKQSPEDYEPKDLGVRLWNPDHRRLPPEPKKKEQPHDDDP